MTALPQPQHSLAASIYRWREQQADEGLRPHLGASLIGHPCARHLWWVFRWARAAKFEGRMLRLFDRGQREEPVLVLELRAIGAEVLDADPDGKQFRISELGGHFAGSMDAIVRKLPAGSSKAWEVAEFKTHNARSYKELVEKGVEKAKRQHWAQMQTYMASTGMERANYIAVCKDDDQIYHERVHADPAAGKALRERAAEIIFAAEPPPGVSEDPTFYQCKFCDHHALCHGQAAPLPTCRSCAHATPERDGTWTCLQHQKVLDLAQQREGCEQHRYIPAVVARFMELHNVEADNVITWRNKATGTLIHQPGYDSREIHRAEAKGLLGDDFIASMKTTFPGARLEQTFKLPPVPEDDFKDDIPWNTGTPQEELEL